MDVEWPQSTAFRQMPAPSCSFPGIRDASDIIGRDNHRASLFIRYILRQLTALRSTWVNTESTPIGFMLGPKLDRDERVMGGPMKLFPIILLIALTGTYLLPQAVPQAVPQSPRQTGIVQGTITRESTIEPIPDVQITVDVPGGPGAVTITGPTGEIITITPQNGQQLLDAVARGGARGLPQEYLDAAQQAVRGNTSGAASAPPPPLTATTDAAGHFTISGVPAGKITVRAQLQGYFGSPVNGNYPAMVTASATVSADKAADVRLSMIPGGTISGRVLDTAGKPLSDTPVQALRRAYSNGTSTLGVINLKASDDHGEYRLYRLPPGEYYLAATPQRISNAFANGASAASEVPAPTLYPGVLDTAAAVPIVLRGGDEITGINIPIKTAATATISGKVIVSVPTEQVNYSAAQRANVPAAVPNVTLARRDGFGLDLSGGGNSIFKPEDGTFEFRNVQAGSYVVIARMPVTANNGWGPQNPPARAGGPVAFGRTSVVVRGVDVKDVAVVVHKGVDLNGRLFVDGKPAAANVRISLQSDDSDLNINDGPTANTLNQISIFNPTLESDGAFTIPLLPEGKYRVQVSILGATSAGNAGGRGQAADPATPAPPPLPAGAYLADVRQAGNSVYDNGLLIGNQASNPIEILVNTNSGSINGAVLGPDQKPVPSTLVVLVPPESRRQNPALYRTVRSDAQGNFVFNTVPPGQYTLFAWENVLTGAWQNAEFLAANFQRGVPVSVSAAERANVNVGLIKDQR